VPLLVAAVTLNVTFLLLCVGGGESFVLGALLGSEAARLSYSSRMISWTVAAVSWTAPRREWRREEKAYERALR
jgi:hypothetical protein